MKKNSLFVLGLVSMMSLSAANFVKNEAGYYQYVGDSVETWKVDFTTWAPEDLVDEAVGEAYTAAPHTLAMAEVNGMGFQKWVIYKSRWISSTYKPNALFNNGKGNNTAAANARPIIYFPAMKSCVKEIKISMQSGWITPMYFDEGTQAWKTLSSVNPSASAYGEYVIDFSSVEAHVVAISTASTTYTTITHVELVPKQAPQPQPERDSLFVRAGSMYTYVGEAKANLFVDFSKWSVDSLTEENMDAIKGGSAPHPLKMVERGGMGFQKWIIYANRWLASGVTKNVIFNNAVGNATAPLSELPIIYLPTIKDGVKAIYLKGLMQSVGVLYQDASTKEWKEYGYFALDAAGKTYDEFKIKFENGTPENVALYFNKDKTGWTSIESLSVYSVNDKEPEPDKPVIVGNYQLNKTNNKWEYIGTPVTEDQYIDFSMIETTALPATLNDTMGMKVIAGYEFGFIKWKIEDNATLGYKVLFNNDNADFPEGLKNNSTANRPAIYFPKTARGIKSVRFLMSFSKNNYGLQMNYADDVKPNNYKGVTVDVTKPNEDGLFDVTTELNSKGQTFLYVMTGSTIYGRILEMELVLEDEPTTGLEAQKAVAPSLKCLENGKIAIYREGHRFNVMGVEF